MTYPDSSDLTPPPIQHYNCYTSLALPIKSELIDGF